MTSFIRCLLIVVLTATTLQVPAQEAASVTPSETPAAAPKPYLASGPQELFARGVELADRGAVQEAKTLFKALTLAYPELPEPHINLAVLLADEGSVEAAADELESAMHAHPVCRAAIDLEFQRQMGLYSATVLGAGAPVPPPAASPVVPAGAPSPPPPAQPAPLPEIAGEVRVVRQAADPCLNFRSEPSSGSAALECLPSGTRVRWLETAGDWSRVALHDGRIGWMAASFLAVPDS